MAQVLDSRHGCHKVATRSSLSTSSVLRPSPSSSQPHVQRLTWRGRSAVLAAKRGRAAGPASRGRLSVAASALNEGIARFYDESSELWESMWGEHMHHGYYPQGEDEEQPVDNQAAQVEMITRTLDWAGITDVKNMVDVGCGIGGSSRFIARKYGASGTGITLSPKQAARANAITFSQGIPNLTYQVADALNQPFEPDTFDLVWSMESGEHMPDKHRFMRELNRVCTPGGKIIIVTWCHRNLDEGEESLRPEEESLLDSICQSYCLPKWCSVNDYVELATELGLENIRTDDWTAEVQPFWGEVIRTALTLDGITGLAKAGMRTIKGALVMPLMARGMTKGTIKFNLITATKPKEQL